MGKLYVFGNGLDLHYGLKTSTQDFLDILRTKRVYNEIDNAAEIFAYYNVLWSDFESDLAKIELNEIEANHVEYPDYISDHEYDRDSVITNVEEYVNSLREAIFDSLSDMIESAEQKIQNLPIDNQWQFKTEDLIISFNYTSTLEKVSNALDVPILYIHGSFAEEEGLILGYKEPLDTYDYQKYSNSENGDYYMEKQLNLIHDFYLSLKKDYQIEKLKSFLKNAKSIDEVIVYGHALGDIDAPYLDYIDEAIQPIRWRVSYHGQDDNVLLNKGSLSFADKISCFEW